MGKISIVMKVNGEKILNNGPMPEWKLESRLLPARSASAIVTAPVHVLIQSERAGN